MIWETESKRDAVTGSATRYATFEGRFAMHRGGHLEFGDTLRKLIVEEIADDAQITLISDAATPVNLDSGLRIVTETIGSNVQIDVNGHLNKLKTETYAGGTLTADSIRHLKIAQGDLTADTTVTTTVGDLNNIKL